MDGAFFGTKDYFVVENVGARQALFAFGSGEAAVYRLSVEGPDGRAAQWSTRERNFCGRLEAAGLQPDSLYTARAHAGEREIAALTFRTLPDVPLSPLLRLAVAADPHVSLDRENRRGRLFQESSCLLQEAVEWACARDVDAILLPGDLTDAGTPEQLRRASEILSAFPGPVFAIPGDHDRGHKRRDPKNGGENAWLYETPFLRSLGPLRVLGLDTSSGLLGEAQQRLLEQAFSEPGGLIILSHHDLLPNPGIIDPDAVVADYEEVGELMRQARPRWVAWCGHKNVPSIVRAGRGAQINAPQTSHYPAGFLYASVFEQAIVQQFVPIRSEILRSYSLRMLGRDDSPSFRPAYRYGSLEARCAIVPWGEG